MLVKKPVRRRNPGSRDQSPKIVDIGSPEIDAAMDKIPNPEGSHYKVLEEGSMLAMQHKDVERES